MLGAAAVSDADAAIRALYAERWPLTQARRLRQPYDADRLAAIEAEINWRELDEEAERLSRSFMAAPRHER